MSLQVRNLRAAREELAAAVEWYERQRSGLGREFLARVVGTVEAIEQLPWAGSPAPDEKTRRRRVPGFPYQIVYRMRPNEIVIVAIAHEKRRPGYWKSRKG